MARHLSLMCLSGKLLKRRALVLEGGGVANESRLVKDLVCLTTWYSNSHVLLVCFWRILSLSRQINQRKQVHPHA